MYKKNLFLITIILVSGMQTILTAETNQSQEEPALTESNFLRKYYTETIAPNMSLIKKVIPAIISGGITGFLSSYAYKKTKQTYFPNNDFKSEVDLFFATLGIFGIERIARAASNDLIASPYRIKRSNRERWITGRAAQIGSWLGFVYGIMR